MGEEADDDDDDTAGPVQQIDWNLTEGEDDDVQMDDTDEALELALAAVEGGVPQAALPIPVNILTKRYVSTFSIVLIVPILIVFVFFVAEPRGQTVPQYFREISASPPRMRTLGGGTAFSPDEI